MANRKPKATSTRVRLWDHGKSLSAAWFVCAARDAKRKYQKCDSDSMRYSLRVDMQFQILDDLISLLSNRLDVLSDVMFGRTTRNEKRTRCQSNC